MNPASFFNPPIRRQEVYANIPTIQFRNQLKNNNEDARLVTLGMITSELNNYKTLLDAYWFSHAKIFVRKIYKIYNNPNRPIKGILCDDCYELEKLKE